MSRVGVWYRARASAIVTFASLYLPGCQPPRPNSAPKAFAASHVRETSVHGEYRASPSSPPAA